jgi:LAGLIDADG endonuclease
VNLSRKTIQPIFQIGLHINDLPLLEFIKNTLKVGRIFVDSKNSKANWVVSSYKDLIQIILPIFDSFPLNSSKYINYLLFKEVVLMMRKKEHLTISGFQRIISIKEKMNKNYVDITMPKNHQVRITTPWLIGFSEGDGSFSTNKLVPRLSIQLTLKDAFLLEAIREFFCTGNIHYEKP